MPPAPGQRRIRVAMEDVLEVYHRESMRSWCVWTRPASNQETRTPLPPRPGAARAYDYEYQRNGVSNLFMLFAPLEGWRRYPKVRLPDGMMYAPE